MLKRRNGVKFREFFKSTIESSPYDYICQHSKLESGSFTKEIVRNLKTAYLVLADITDLNANVLWELGVRHSLSKRTIMVARSDVVKNTIRH